MRNLLIIILVLFIVFESNAKGFGNREKQYQKLAKRSIEIDEINNLLIAYKDSLSLPNNSNNDIAFYNIVISKLYYLLGAYNKSVDYGKVALKEYKEQKDTAFIMYALINIGAIYGENSETVIAFDYFSQIEKLAKASNDTDALTYNYINMGTVFSGKDNEKALKYYGLAEKYGYKKAKTKFFRLYILNGRAGVYYKQNKFRKSLKSYLLAFNTIDSTHLFYNGLCTNIAETYKKLGLIDSSLYYANKVIFLNSNFRSINNLANTYSIVAENYILKGQNDSAKLYFKLFCDYNDSIILNKKIEYVSKLKVINETDKLLEKNEIQKQELNEYNTKLKFVLLLAGIILIALFVVILLYRKVQKSYKTIVKESVQSLKMEDEVKRLRQIIPTEQEIKKTNIENSDKIYYQIIKLLEEDKLYTDHSFTLNKLSEIIGVNRTYVSNVINDKTNDSFIKLVNQYRIKEAKRLLIDEQNKNLTLEAIGEASGFKSSSSFYRVFKTETGVTPSFYIKNKN